VNGSGIVAPFGRSDMRSLRGFPAWNNVTGGGKIGRRDGCHGKRWRRSLAQEDVYRVVGGQLGPRTHGLVEYGILGGIVVDVGDATEA